MPKRVFTQAERDLMQQPIDADGFSSTRFDKLYGAEKNPHIGTERDRRNRKFKNVPLTSGDKYAKGWLRIFGNENNRNNKRKV